MGRIDPPVRAAHDADPTGDGGALRIVLPSRPSAAAACFAGFLCRTAERERPTDQGNSASQGEFLIDSDLPVGGGGTVTGLLFVGKREPARARRGLPAPSDRFK